MDFQTYIYRVMKSVHPENGCTSKSISQLNQIINVIAENIVDNSINLCKSINHITISCIEIQCSVRILLPSELAKHAISNATKAVTKYNSSIGSSDDTSTVSDKPRKRREKRAGLKFPVARCAKLIKDINRGMRVGQGAPVYLAAILEYLMTKILELSGNICTDYNRKCITPRHVFIAISSDPELSTLFNSMKIYLLDSGVMPYIYKKLLPNKNKTKKLNKTTDNTKKPHRFKPGTVALREIRRYQKTTEDLTQFAPFERYVRNLSKNMHGKYKFQFSDGSLSYLHKVMEYHLIDILNKTQEEALHAGRTSICPDDINIVLKMVNYNTPECFINDDETFIVKNAIVRLARRAGIKRIDSKVYPEIRNYAASFINNVLDNSMIFVEHRKAVNITVDDLQKSLKILRYGNYIHTNIL